MGESYLAEEAENVDKAYELVSTSGNTRGEITEKVIEVIYYYQLKDPVINDSIAKITDTQVVTDTEQKNHIQ